MRKSKKKRIYNLNREICGNLEKMNLFLELIAYYRVENLKEALVLADAALFFGKRTYRHNEEICMILEKANAQFL